MTKTHAKTKTLREHLQRAAPETYDFLRHLIRVMRRHDLTKKNAMTKTNKRQWQRQIHLDSTFKEQS